MHIYFANSRPAEIIFPVLFSKRSNEFGSESLEQCQAPADGEAYEMFHKMFERCHKEQGKNGSKAILIRMSEVFFAPCR